MKTPSLLAHRVENLLNLGWSFWRIAGLLCISLNEVEAIAHEIYEA